MRDPLRNAVSAEWVKRQRRARRCEARILFCSGWGLHDHQKIGRGGSQIILEGFVRVFAKTADVAENQYSTLSHHRRSAEQNTQGFSIELAGTSDIEVEVCDSCIHRRFYQL